MSKQSTAILLGGLRRFKNEFGDHIFDCDDYNCNDLLTLMLESYTKRLTKKLPIDVLMSASTIAYALNKWRRNKKVYKFDNDFLKSLYTSKFSDFPMPFKTIIDKLENGIFIEAKDANIIGYIYSIAFEEGTRCLVAVPVRNDIDKRIDSLKCIVVELNDKSTIQEALESMISNINNAVRDIGSSKHFTVNDEKDYFIKGIAPLLYILSNNADIEQDPDNIDSFCGIDATDIADRYSEVQVFNVGYNIAKDIQAMNEIVEELRSEGNVSVGVRSGHWRSRSSANGVNLHYVSPTMWSKNEAPATEIETDREKELRLMVEQLQKELDNKNQYINELEKKYLSLEAKCSTLEAGFSLRDKELDNDNAQNTSIRFPWYTDKKITVFGGHPSWVNKIKPMLPNVRFVDRTTQGLNPNLIKSSDIIWVQSNALSHSLYNSIMSIVRQYDKPIKYFNFASSEKCAIQLVEEMSK